MKEFFSSCLILILWIFRSHPWVQVCAIQLPKWSHCPIVISAIVCTIFFLFSHSATVRFCNFSGYWIVIFICSVCLSCIVVRHYCHCAVSIVCARTLQKRMGRLLCQNPNRHMLINSSTMMMSVHIQFLSKIVLGTCMKSFSCTWLYIGADIQQYLLIRKKIKGFLNWFYYFKVKYFILYN